MNDTRTGRRPVLVAAVRGAAALGVAAVATKAGSEITHATTGQAPALRLASGSSKELPSLTVRLGGDLLPSVGGGRWETARLATSTHSMVGFTWTGDHAPQIRTRSRIDGRWTAWQAQRPMDDLPDPGTGEDSGIRGTHLAWIGKSDGIQVQVRGRRPRDLSLVLLHARRLRTDRLSGRRARRREIELAPSARATTQVPPPSGLRTRKDWAANESWRDGSPRYNSTIQQVHVHHTASGNTYERGDVAALIRGFYRYHTHNLGWSDIGYNFLVDRFGRAWVGRAGGAARAVRGAHTLGFNATSVGIAVIGNFETATPAWSVLKKISEIAAWKLSHYDRNPRGMASVVSEGSDKYPAGRTVRLPVIDGHRNTNDTACPGSYLFAKLPAIRRKTEQLMAGAAAPPPPVAVATASRISGNGVIGHVVSVVRGSYTPADATSRYTWRRDGTAIPGATGAAYRVTPADFGTKLTADVVTSRSGYTSTTEHVGVPGGVRAPTTVHVKPRRKFRRAVVRVRVAAPDVAARPTGRVTVELLGRRTTVRLVDGVAVAKFWKVPGGRTTAQVRYWPSGPFQRSRASHAVKVLG